MRIPEQTITEISEKLDIVDVVADYVPLTRKGNRYWGLCPFHTEKTPSFSVTPEKNIYYCFGCHKGGGALSFIMEMEKLPFIEAIRIAAKRAGVEIELEEEREGSLKRDAYCELYKRVAGSLNHILRNSEQALQARKYLQGRKISEDIIGMFQLGYAPAEREWLFNFLEKKNYSADFLSKTGLFSKGKNSYFSNRIMFPISTAQDEVIAFGGRALVEGGPKYLNTPETPFFRKRNSLFALNLALPAIKKEGSVYLVEGYMDAIAMHAAGITNCVAPLGTAFTREQAAFLKRYAEKAVLFFDTDEAGIKATLRTIEILESASFQVEIVSQEGQKAPNGPCKDPAEIFEKDGGEALKNILKCSINSFQFILRRASNIYDTNTLPGKEGFFSFLKPYLSGIASGIRRDSYLRMAAEALGVSDDVLSRDMESGHGTRIFHKPVLPVATGSGGLEKELFTMVTVALNMELFAELRKRVSLDDFEDQHARELYIALEECFRNEEKTLESLLGRLDNSDIKDILLRKAASEEMMINQAQMVDDGIRDIRQKSLKRRRAMIFQKMRHAEQTQADPDLIRDLQLEIMNIDEELKKLEGKGAWQK